MSDKVVFSSFGFLFIFLPIFLGGYFIIKPSLRNFYLFLFSFFFYYVGEPKRSWILLAYVVVNYGCALWIDRAKIQKLSYIKIVLTIGISLNLLLLGYFKYIGFITENLYKLFTRFHLESWIRIIEVALPLGISFVTFQGISYLIDVYRGEVRASKNFIVIGTYISMFPHLVAGPIVRYKQVEEELNQNRRLNIEDFSCGASRFCVGLLKKVLLADTIAVTADQIFAIPNSEINFSIAWLGAITYTLQIYFDFSGYSDMAIGLARMMGFHFPENFNYPYIAKSIQDFWRRWHMTLSSWFRDYLYIPLGGNRKGSYRTYYNLGVVFLLTGLWHGAAWTFVIWGLWHGSFLVLERLFSEKKWQIPSIIKHFYTLSVIIFGWVIFRSETIKQAKTFFKSMLGFNGVSFVGITEFINEILAIAIIMSLIISLPVYSQIRKYLENPFFYSIYMSLGVILMVLAGLKILTGSYSPFLYFRF